MDAMLLSRIQFGLTAFFHFFFPPLTIGLATLLAVFEFLYWRKGNPLYDQMSRFWFRILTILFTVGVATGITMEFEFGTNWSQYSRFVGDIFGAPLAAEGVFAFFLESTFFGLLLFGRDKISKTMRFFASLFVALGSTLSAFWIIVANSWQQTPAGYKVEGGRAILTDFFAAVFNPSTLPRYLHTVDGAYITGAFFVMGLSAYLLLKKQKVEIAKTSLKFALIFAFIAIIAQVMFGDIHARQVAATQPAKLATFEAMWKTGPNAPLHLIGIPNVRNQSNDFSIGIPNLLSIIVKGNANGQIQGLSDFPAEERPPMLPVYWSYRLMVLLAGWFGVMALWGIYLLFKGKLYTNTAFLKAALCTSLLPLLTNEFGWIAAEMGRQPWIVFGLLKTQQAASTLPAGQILFTILLFVAVYLILGVTAFKLVKRELVSSSFNFIPNNEAQKNINA